MEIALGDKSSDSFLGVHIRRHLRVDVRTICVALLASCPIILFLPIFSLDLSKSYISRLHGHGRFEPTHLTLARRLITLLSNLPIFSKRLPMLSRMRVTLLDTPCSKQSSRKHC